MLNKQGPAKFDRIDKLLRSKNLGQRQLRIPGYDQKTSGSKGGESMKELPIIFSTDMVEAILAGKKRATRRVIKNPERLQGLMLWGEEPAWCPYGGPGDLLYVRETWRVGAWNLDDMEIAVDYLAGNYARREWLTCDEKIVDRLIDQSIEDAEKALGKRPHNYHEFDWEPGESPCRWRRSIHMPKAFARIWLRVEDVRAERLQEITQEGAILEGARKQRFVIGNYADKENRWSMEYPFPDSHARCLETARMAFANFINKLHGGKNWSRKPTSLWAKNPWVWVVEFSVISTTGRKVTA